MEMLSVLIAFVFGGALIGRGTKPIRRMGMGICEFGCDPDAFVNVTLAVCRCSEQRA